MKNYSSIESADDSLDSQEGPQLADRPTTGRPVSPGATQKEQVPRLEPHAAVDLNISSIDEIILHQELHAMRDFVGLADAACGNHGLQLGQRIRFH